MPHGKKAASKTPMDAYADGCRATSISTGHPTRKSRRSSSRPTSRPANASASRRHSKPCLPSLERMFKSASLKRVALRSGIQGGLVQTMDDGKHDILPVAGAILDHARVPVMLPRQSDADMRRDGSTTAQTVPNPPSLSAEECTAPQDSQAGHGSTRWLSSERTVSQNGASPDTVESRRRRWPRRERDPRLRVHGAPELADRNWTDQVVE